MKNRKVLYMVLGALLLTGLIIGTLLIVNKGAPVTDVSALALSEPIEDGQELSSINAKSSAKVEGMKLVVDNGELALFINEQSTEVAVVNLATGETWYSNPQERANDSLASTYEKALLSSQLILQYRDMVGNLYTSSNYDKSIESEQFIVESITDGVRITYTLGDVSKGIDALPKYISKERFETKVLANLPEGSVNYVKARYMERKDKSGVMERLDAQVQKQLVLNKMIKAFEESGYTEEDLAFDEAENGAGTGPTTEKPKFTIALEYRLDGDQLVAKVPVATIEESPGYLIRSVDILPFFGAAGMQDEGYMFVPDGSGSLIYLNNGKVKEEQYVQRVYGNDPNNSRWSRGMVSESARMPVFGLARNDAGWIAEMTKGEAIGSITSSISGMKNSYNNVYASFSLRGEDWLELYTGNVYQDIQILNEERYNGDLEVRYSFLSGENADYSGMAERYRKHLIDAGVLQQLASEENIPFYLDIIGSYDTRESFLGVPYRAIDSLTTFQQAGTIANQLSSQGINNVNMRYVGWFDKGIRHGTPNRTKIDSELGNRDDLQQLAAQLQQNGGNLFPDVAFQLMYKDDLSFTPSSDASRFVTREVVELHPVNRSINSMSPLLGSHYLLSPSKLPYFVDKFLDSYNGYNLTGVSLRDLGNVLGADYRVSRVVHRETAKEVVKQSLQQISEQQETLIVGGHAYAWAYADHIIDVPASSSNFNITDESVPFYQMVLHGYIPYTGNSINLSDEQDAQYQTLIAIEQGAYPHFIWSYDDSSELKFTSYDEYFSTQYEIWLEDAVTMYSEVNEVLRAVSNATISQRIVHEPGVVEVQYDNGQVIIVNYSEQAVTVNGVQIAPRNYSVGGERS
ncbi:MAG TPA: hypothetical protein IAA29_17390 [Candidatus Paenibacillus intestinavium]|nr:hypothetical protein [Candidatus Paenibacillus intestinavium]